MSADYRRVKGTRDILPPESGVWAAVEETARRTFDLYGFREIRTPILEHTELFVRSVGEATDIVGKEMYTFEDRKGRSLTLRPETTASVARAYVENGLQTRPQPVKLFYVGPQFRYERPQRGRYRQFHQIGAEILGDDSPAADVELLLMLARFLRDLEFRGLVVLLNTVGDEASRKSYREALRSFLEPHREELGEDSRRRLATNPLRILDTKVPREREILAGAPSLAEHLTPDARKHYDEVREGLAEAGVAFRVDDRLVRGLDYYAHTVFEIVSEELGAQDALVGGGRYDGLVAALGGPDVAGIGFAIGEDRLVEVLPESFRERCRPEVPVFAIPIGEESAAEARRLCEELRDVGIPCHREPAGRSVGSSLKRADRAGAAVACLLGEAETREGTVTVKDLVTGDQVTVPRSEAADVIEELRSKEGGSR